MEFCQITLRKSYVVKVKFCQFELWMLYCTSVVLSGKLFRIKMCLWPNPISVNLLYKSKSSQLVYFLQLLKVLPSSAYHLGMPYKRCEQCSFLCRRGQVTLGWESLASSQHACTSWCAPVPARHVDCISLKSAWVELSLAAVIKILWSFSGSTPPDWNNFWLNTATFEILIDDKFLNYHCLPRRMKRNSLAAKREHDEISSVSAD